MFMLLMLYVSVQPVVLLPAGSREGGEVEGGGERALRERGPGWSCGALPHFLALLPSLACPLSFVALFAPPFYWLPPVRCCSVPHPLPAPFLLTFPWPSLLSSHLFSGFPVSVLADCRSSTGLSVYLCGHPFGSLPTSQVYRPKSVDNHAVCVCGRVYSHVFRQSVTCHTSKCPGCSA